MVVGLVYMNDGFYYHAWVQYWPGKRWFTGDPLMNQLPADPTHIALLYGDVEKHVNVITFLGRIKLYVSEAK
jgi:transglutaminase-like putative cysteine protease